jgi:hypothetical protein
MSGQIPTGPGAADEARTGAKVIQLRPIRTLTIARDLAFRQRAMTILSELGPTAFAVTPLERIDEVLELIAEQRADVVVLDVTFCASALPHAMAALSEKAPRVGIVTVSDRGAHDHHSMPFLAKWGWAAELAHAAQEAYRRGNPLKEEASDVRHHQL